MPTSTSAPPPAAALLTIIVPTYNRARHVDRLLRVLQAELRGVEDDVVVLVSDNASSDGTADVIRAVQAGWPALVAQRHAENLGADGNFCACVERVATRYFWIMGDDDLPRPGVVAGMVDILRKSAPAVVYMQSEWAKDIEAIDPGERVGALHARSMDAADFARRVHVWFTFISAVIVDRTLLLETAGAASIRRYVGTSLVQLGWILPLLKVDGRFVLVSDRCMLATMDNSGGYPLLTVFGVRFARIAHELFGRDSRLANAILRGTLLHYLPPMVWNSRSGTQARHQAEDPWPGMRAELGGFLLFWALLVPLGRFPNWLAQPFYQSWRVFRRVGGVLGRIAARAARRPA